MNRASGYLVWIAVALLGAFAFGTIALAHGERISALWIVIAAVCVYLIAYRFYSASSRARSSSSTACA